MLEKYLFSFAAPLTYTYSPFLLHLILSHFTPQTVEPSKVLLLYVAYIHVCLHTLLFPHTAHTNTHTHSYLHFSDLNQLDGTAVGSADSLVNAGYNLVREETVSAIPPVGSEA